MKALPTDLHRRADALLHAYDGLDGLSRNPPWVIGIVLRTWFTAAERKLLVEFMLDGVERKARVPLLNEFRR